MVYLSSLIFISHFSDFQTHFTNFTRRVMFLMVTVWKRPCVANFYISASLL